MAKRPSRTAPSASPGIFVPEGSVVVGPAPRSSAQAGQQGTVLGIVPPGGLTLNLVPRAPQPPAAPQTPAGMTEDGARIHIWQDDPGSGVLAIRPVPILPGSPGLEIQATAPAPGLYQPSTVEFRYWITAEAVTRATALWRAIIAKAAPDLAWGWNNMATLPVLLDDPAPEFNAFYDRAGLKFFHADTNLGTVYSGESPDIVCHELGHAVLDAIKPELWGAASHEAGAFHEAFGDISALLSALQLPELRAAVLNDTGGQLYTSSRLSRLAEQLGAALRTLQPQDVDPDCLRNAVNSFVYRDPIGLQPLGPASQLSSEPHSFSRVFSGAFLEVLATLLSATAANPNNPSDMELCNAAEELAVVLIKAILNAPVVSNLYAQVAAGMVVEAARTSALHASVLRGVFVRRGILSPRSAGSLAGSQLDQKMAITAALAPPLSVGLVAVSAGAYGIGKALLLEPPSQHHSFSATSAAPDASPIEPPSGLAAAKSFADDIFRRGRVDYAGAAGDTPMLHIGRRFTTHKLVSDDASVRLTRRCFDCGLRRD